jgi:hypothetical protein
MNSLNEYGFEIQLKIFVLGSSAAYSAKPMKDMFIQSQHGQASSVGD